MLSNHEHAMFDNGAGYVTGDGCGEFDELVRCPSRNFRQIKPVSTNLSVEVCDEN
jgi:hypothetical protein